MPTSTFANLPPDKRERIITTALEEFAEHPYAVASISSIVERAGIAKGSLYQYFSNKQDLFLFLVEHAARTQLQLLSALSPPAPELGFFEMLRWQMSASVHVGLAAPQLVRLMQRATADDLPFRDDVRRRLEAMGEGYLFQLVRDGVARGEVETTLDPELVAFVITSLMSELGALIARRLGVDVADAAADVSRLTGPEAESIYDAVIDLLRHGLAPRAGTTRKE